VAESRESARVALVTGAAKRVGRAIAIELANCGFDIAIHCRESIEDARRLATDIERTGRRTTVIPADLSDPKCWPRMVPFVIEAFGRLDVLINNASVFTRDTVSSANESNASPDTFDPAHWERTFRINVVAAAALCQSARPHLARTARGKIINLLDVCADRPWPDYLAYGASKAALAAVTKGLAVAFAPEIQVCGVAPGIALFPDNYTPAMRDRLVGRIPLGRAGTQEEVARLVRFLVESADYITGQIIAIDGGRSVSW